MSAIFFFFLFFERRQGSLGFFTFLKVFVLVTFRPVRHILSVSPDLSPYGSGDFFLLTKVFSCDIIYIKK